MEKLTVNNDDAFTKTREHFELRNGAIATKDALRQQIAEDIAGYVAAGGVITVLERATLDSPKEKKRTNKPLTEKEIDAQLAALMGATKQ